MNLRTSQYIEDPAAALPPANSDTGWQAVSNGLHLVTWGYLFMVIGAVVGPYLIWEAEAAGPLARHWAFSRSQQENVLLLGVAVLGVSALASYALTLIGQWQCLMYAPERQGSKEQMFICITCVALGLGLNVAANVVGGAENSLALQQALGGFERPDFFKRGGILQLASAAASLLSMVVFCQFLRTIASCFRDRARMRQADLYMAGVGILIGGTVGSAYFLIEFTGNTRVLLALAAAWLSCFFLQSLLILSVRACIQTGLDTQSGWLRVQVSHNAVRGPSKVLRILAARQAR